MLKLSFGTCEPSQYSLPVVRVQFGSVQLSLEVISVSVMLPV